MQKINNLEILEKLYYKKDFSTLIEELSNNNDSTSYYFLAKIYFIQRDFEKAVKYFEKCKNYSELARCKFIKKDINSAKNILKKNKDENPLSDWIDILIQIIDEKVTRFPTFFEVRNFLEVDLSTLFETGNIDFAEKIVNSSDFFVQANAEANKFFARVLHNYHYNGISQNFLDKSVPDITGNIRYLPGSHAYSLKIIGIDEKTGDTLVELYNPHDTSESYVFYGKDLKPVLYDAYYFEENKNFTSKVRKFHAVTMNLLTTLASPLLPESWEIEWW